MLSRLVHNAVARVSLCLAILLIGVEAVGLLCAGEEVLILDTHKTDALLDWGKRVLSEDSSWQVMDNSWDRVLLQ